MRSAPTLTWDFASCKSSIDVFLAVAPHLGTRTGAAAMHVVSVRRSWCGWVKPMSDAWAAVSWNARTPILERVRAESGMRLAQNHWSEHCARAAQHNEDWLGFAWPGPRLRPPPEPLRRRRPTRITRIQPHAKRHLDARVHAQTSPTRKAQIRRADGCVGTKERQARCAPRMPSLASPRARVRPRTCCAWLNRWASRNRDVRSWPTAAQRVD